MYYLINHRHLALIKRIVLYFAIFSVSACTPQKEIEVISSGMAPALEIGQKVKVRIAFSFERDEIIYFKNYISSVSQRFPFMFSRIIGVPGDTVEIKYGKVYVNGCLKQLDTKSQFFYSKFPPSFLNSELFKEFKSSSIAEISRDSILLFLTDNEADTFKAKAKDFTKEKIILPANVLQERIFGGNNYNLWNIDNFGPIIVPGSNTKIITDNKDNDFYNELNLKGDESGKVLNGERIFYEEYFFVLGDNRYNCIDSRFIGLINEKDIAGKVKVKR